MSTTNDRDQPERGDAAATTPLPAELPETPVPVSHGPDTAWAAHARTDSPERPPLVRRTWVKVAGAAVAALLLLGIGFGTGWAASTAATPSLASGPGTWGRDANGMRGMGDEDGDHMRPGPPSGGMHHQDDDDDRGDTAPDDGDDDGDS